MSSYKYDAVYAKYWGPRIAKFTTETTEEEIKEVYRDWAAEYNKVLVAFVFHAS